EPAACDRATRACDAQHRGLRGAGAAAGQGSLTSRRISQPTGHEPADASFVRHRPLPTPHRGGLSSDVGDLAAGRAAEKLRSRGACLLILLSQKAAGDKLLEEAGEPIAIAALMEATSNKLLKPC